MKPGQGNSIYGDSPANRNFKTLKELFPENNMFIELKVSSMKQVYFKNALFGLWLNYLQDNVASLPIWSDEVE